MLLLHARTGYAIPQIAWWAVTRRTTQTTETAKIGGWALARDNTVIAGLEYGMELCDLNSITEKCLYMYFILNDTCMPLSQPGIGLRAHLGTAALNAAQVITLLSNPSNIHPPVGGNTPPHLLPTRDTIFPGAGDLGHLREESIPGP